MESKDITLLIVEDDEALRNALEFDFKRKGFIVLLASNGKDAFELVKNNKINVVLTDVRMPGGDGVTLLDQIKEFNPATPTVMFVTGFADISLEEAYHRGADAVFEKPFDRKSLVAAVTKAATPPKERWVKRPERFQAEFSVDLVFPELKMAIKSKGLNIGRGGMCLVLEREPPLVEAGIEFKIHFSKSYPSEICGIGIVRWVRANSCGVEFVNLDQKSLDGVLAFLEETGTKSFIPKE